MVVRNRILKAKFLPDGKVRGGEGGDEKGQLFHNLIVLVAEPVEAELNFSKAFP